MNKNAPMFTPYLAVKAAKEAANLYVATFKGKAGEAVYGNSVLGFENSEHAKKIVIYLPIYFGNNVIYLCDAKTDDFQNDISPHVTIFGTNISLIVNLNSKAEVNEAFKKLCEHGHQMVEPHDTFWGDYFARVKDKYEVIWDLSYNKDTVVA